MIVRELTEYLKTQDQEMEIVLFSNQAGVFRSISDISVLPVNSTLGRDSIPTADKNVLALQAF